MKETDDKNELVIMMFYDLHKIPKWIACLLMSVPIYVFIHAVILFVKERSNNNSTLIGRLFEKMSDDNEIPSGVNDCKHCSDN